MDMAEVEGMDIAGNNT
jgi:hypothetical protein